MRTRQYVRTPSGEKISVRTMPRGDCASYREWVIRMMEDGAGIANWDWRDAEVLFPGTAAVRKRLGRLEAREAAKQIKLAVSRPAEPRLRRRVFATDEEWLNQIQARPRASQRGGATAPAGRLVLGTQGTPSESRGDFWGDLLSGASAVPTLTFQGTTGQNLPASERRLADDLQQLRDLGRLDAPPRQ